MSNATQPSSGQFCREGERELYAFVSLEAVFSVLLSAFITFYTYKVWGELRNPQRWRQGNFVSHVWFIIAIAGLAIVYAVRAGMRHHDNWQLVSIFTGPVASYLIVISSCFIFFSWTASYAERISIEFKNFYEKCRKVINGILITIMVLFVTTYSIIIATHNKIGYIIESALSMTRDIAISIPFIVYHIKLKKIAEPLNYCGHNSESWMLLACLVIIISFYIRPLIVLIHCLYWASWAPIPIDKRVKQCSYGYFAYYGLEELFIQIGPLIFVGITKIISLNDNNTAKTDERFDLAFTEHEYLVFD